MSRHQYSPFIQRNLPFLLAVGTLLGLGYELGKPIGNGILRTDDDPEPDPKRLDDLPLKGGGTYGDYFSYDDILALGDLEAVDVCEEYDPSAAQECVDAWASVTLEDFRNSKNPLVRKIFEDDKL